MGHCDEQSPHHAPARTSTFVLRVNVPSSFRCSSVMRVCSVASLHRARCASVPYFARNAESGSPASNLVNRFMCNWVWGLSWFVGWCRVFEAHGFVYGTKAIGG